jgi:hypothetical protein
MLSSYEKQTSQHIPSMVPFLVFKQVLRNRRGTISIARSNPELRGIAPFF